MLPIDLRPHVQQLGRCVREVECGPVSICAFRFLRQPEKTVCKLLDMVGRKTSVINVQIDDHVVNVPQT